MRCCCCNENLNDYESTLRGAKTGDFLDMCRKCLKDLNIEILPNKNNPDDPSEGDEQHWFFDEVEFNPFNGDQE